LIRYFINDATINLREAVEVNRKFGDNVQLLQGILTEIVDSRKLKVKRTEGLHNGDGLENRPDEIISYDYLGKDPLTVYVIF
jgi:hypothetical protein